MCSRYGESTVFRSQYFGADRASIHTEDALIPCPSFAVTVFNFNTKVFLRSWQLSIIRYGILFWYIFVFISLVFRHDRSNV